MTKEYNQSLELSYEEKNNDLTQDTSLIHNISIENISVENHEKTNIEIINDHLDKLKIEASENESSDLNNLIEECKTVKKDDTNSYSLIISLLNYISRNIMKVNKNFQNISAVKTMINYIFVELEENKNEKIKEILIRMFNFLFCEGELNFNKELFFTKLFKEIKFIKFKEIKNKIKEIKEDVLKSEFLFENLKNEFNKQEEINGALKLENNKIIEENQKNCKNIAVLEERFNQFSNFINELLRLLNVDGCFKGDLFFTFDKIKEKFIKIQEENENLKNEEKFEKLKNKFDKLFKKAEEENLKKDKEIELLKEKNEKYKDCLKKFKKSYLELVEENENKGQIIKKQACVIDFFKKCSLCDNLSVDQLKEKIEKIKGKLCKERNEDLKFFMMNDLKDYEKIYCDLVNLKK